MTKAAALNQFFNSFGLEAYEENVVYSFEEPPVFPYITYEMATDSFSDESGIPLSASLWYRSFSWMECNAKAEEIAAYVGDGGKIIDFDGGHIWIKRGTPFAQSIGDVSDDMVRRKALLFQVEFFSQN